MARIVIQCRDAESAEKREKDPLISIYLGALCVSALNLFYPKPEQLDVRLHLMDALG